MHPVCMSSLTTHSGSDHFCSVNEIKTRINNVHQYTLT
jgi:hypothetical protein